MVQFSRGRNEAEFIKKYNLEKYNIMSDWKIDGAANIDNLPNPYINKTWLAIAPYFEKNIIKNFNTQTPELNYLLHKHKTTSCLFSLCQRYLKSPRNPFFCYRLKMF